MLDFNRWPEDLERRYRAHGYWRDRPLFSCVAEEARARPEAVAVICRGREITYGALDAMSDALAARLSAAGLGHGDTALVQLPNVAEFYAVFLALLKIGVVPVNAIFSHKRVELLGYATQIRPRLLIAARAHPLFSDDAFLAELREAAPELETVLFLGDEGEERDLAAWLEGAAPVGFAACPTPPGEVAFFQLSGGSTGTPKLIPRTHNDYDYSLRASAEICGTGPATRFLCAIPAPHNFVLSSPGALGVFASGGTVVLAPDPNPATCFDLIARHGVTMAALVPSAAALWIEAAGAGDARLATLDLVQVGGANFAEATARRLPGALGCRLQQVFGMAEGLVNYTRLDDDPETVFTTQGRPISPDDEVKVTDQSGRPVPDGVPGLIAVRGPYTFRGYFRSPEENAKVFDAEGFYYSGDVVERRGDGYLRVVGRVKDQINRGGEKIAAEEVENLLLRHPDVREAALVAVSDPHLGEKSCAVIVARGTVKPSALRRHVMALGVADYKLPDRFRFVEEMPLTPVGKIDKVRLRADMAAEAQAAAG